MAITTTVTAISTNGGGAIHIHFNKRERVFDSLASLQAFAASVMDRDALEAFAVAMMLDRQPAFGNPAVFVGHSITVNFQAAVNLVTLG